MNRIKQQVKRAAPVETGAVYCPMCTHTVEVEIQRDGRHVHVKSGQKCPRCSASMGAGYVLPMNRAA